MELNYIYNNMNLDKYKKKFEKLQNIIGKNAKIILEIGGHYGEDTLRFYKYFPNSKIYTFEPDPRNIKILKKMCNNIDNINIIENAVSDVEKELSFYMAYTDFNNKLQDKYKYIGLNDYKKLNLNNSGSSSLKKSNRKDLINSKEIKVKSIKLDDWYNDNKDIDIIDFLWIDVQGAEKEVIKGSKNMLDKVKFIQMEYGETSYEGGLNKEDTYAMMINYNFELILDYNPDSPHGDFLFKNRIY